MKAEDQYTLEFAPDRSTAGFRLHSFSVYNWGTFHGRVHTFTPDGRTSLLSGGNGAGKSTLADAVLTLLIDSRKRNYNQASAGGGERKQKKERSEKDYILGTYSEVHDEDLRSRRPERLRKAGNTITVLLGYFFNETYQSHVSLAQVLWLTPAGKLDRAYIVAKRKLTIEDDFDELGGPAEVRRKLRERALEPIDTFSMYSQKFHEALFLSQDRNPMDIFNQAVCIKDISNLTSFIREYMLDDGGAPKKLEDLRSNFDELRLTYERIKREKERLERLSEIRHNHTVVESQDERIRHWQVCLEAAPLYFAEAELSFRKEEESSINIEILKARADETRADVEAEKQNDLISDLDQAINASDAGRRLQQIDQDLARLEEEIAKRKPVHEKFTQRLRKWRPGADCRNEIEFGQIMRDAEADLPSLQKHSEELERSLTESRNRRDGLVVQQGEIDKEIRSLQDRTGNIDRKLVQIRAGIAAALGVSAKDLPFVGELVQVKESETSWTGAIERLARSFALCILVPDNLRKPMDDHMHRTNVRGLVVYHVVDGLGSSENYAPDGDCVSGKLEISEDAGDFSGWLAKELGRRFGHICRNSPDDAFHTAASAITINGLIKHKGSERRKDDRFSLNDASRFVLGWDNSTKINAYQKSYKEIEGELQSISGKIQKAESEKKLADLKLHAAKALPDIAASWNYIDYFTPVAEQEELRFEKKKLEAGSDQLKSLHERLEAAKVARKAAKELAKKAQERLGEYGSLLKQNDEGKRDCSQIIDAAEQESEKSKVYRSMYPALEKLIEIPPTDMASVARCRQDVNADLVKRRSEANKRRDEAATKAKDRMKEFLTIVKHEEPKIHDELYSEGINVPGYNGSLYQPFETLRKRIEEEDLPKNQKRFNRLLQTNLIEDVSNFDGLLAQHAETIKRRIQDLNQHLKEVDFDRNKRTYIQLDLEKTEDEHQKWFRNLRQYALENILQTESTDEQRKERFERVSHLLKELEKDEKRTQRVIDVRNWFDFRADEYYREDDRCFQSYSGASGKSGGEKNRLASTILATSIAYQYGISLNNDRQTETFRLVVVDEMFSKTDDEFSTYLLELFKQFNLQLIIVQPLDSKVHLVQKYVERYHIVTRPEQCSEIHNLSVHEYAKLMAEIDES